eukprot:4728725-Prymnesium_polylepis.1
MPYFMFLSGTGATSNIDADSMRTQFALLSLPPFLFLGWWWAVVRGGLEINKHDSLSAWATYLFDHFSDYDPGKLWFLHA